LFGFSQLIHPFSDMNYSLFFTCISLWKVINNHNYSSRLAHICVYA
jgi:hypothetical protein